MRRDMICNVDRFFPEPSAELRYICHRDVVQLPKRVLVECFYALHNAYLNAIGQEVVLPEKILLLNTGKKLRIIVFAH